MSRLLIFAGECAPDAAVTRTGGHPLAPPEFDWPNCATCSGAMQFIAHLPNPNGGSDRAVAVFMCSNDPGMCDDWAPAAGGNRAYSFHGPLAPVPLPSAGETTLGAVSECSVVTVTEPDYGDARAAWSERTGADLGEVLGGLGGGPDWLQVDETPTCHECAGPMRFVAHLEEGRDRTTAINFGGGGLGYVFECGQHATAAFLWQR